MFEDDAMLIELRSASIAVQVRADEGGRISSLVCRKSGTEFLTQAKRDRPPFAVGLQAQFRDGPCAGIEDCLPTVGAGGDGTEGGAVPDHGDFWQLPWTVMERTDATSVQMEAKGFSRPLLLRKNIGVDGKVLTMRYQVANTGAEPTTLLYALHPLLLISEGDRVWLTREVRGMEVTYARGAAMQHLSGPVSWPRAGADREGVDLSVTGKVSDRAAAMLYSDQLERGVCGLYRTDRRQGILLRFDTARLPYLGVWLCYGGWPDAPNDAPQYAVALEPTTAPCNRLDQAQRAGTAMRLAPGASASWQVAFEVTPPGQSYAEFVREVEEGHAL